MGGITLGSLFDGIGGFPYAASFYGIRTLWASEVMPDCVSVTRRHFPDMEHMGDITCLRGGKLPPVDIITFGSPCQGLSIAGQRRGLADGRSGLFKEAVRIIDEMREATDGRYPKFALWENVPGAFSSAGGRDFRAVLEALTAGEVPMPCSGKWANAGMVRGGAADLAWCVYDAQYFGTAQRRRRVFLVADLTGGCAGEILFVPKSLRRYFETGGTPWQGLASFAEGGAGGTGGETAPGALTGRDTYCIAGNIIGRQNHNGGNGLGYQENISYTLTAMDRHAVSAPAITMRIRSGCEGGGKGPLLQIEKSGTLATGNDQYLFDPGIRGVDVLNDQGGSSMTVERSGISPTLRSEAHGNLPIVAGSVEAIGINGDLAGPLAASYYKGTGERCGKERDVVLCAATGQSHAEILDGLSPTLNCACEQPYIVRASTGYYVRRLTPLECERLQGFPDGWTGLGHDGRPVSDSKRYQMLGNSIAVPCAAYIMQGIRQALSERSD